MAIGDKAGLETIQEFNKETLPKLQALVDSFLLLTDKIVDEDWSRAVRDAHELLDRLDGMTITLHVPKRRTGA